MSPSNESVLVRARDQLREIVQKEGWLDARVEVLGKALTPEEAIGTPGRRDFPILLGKERVLEASVDNARGHAFTDTAREYTGTLTEILRLKLVNNAERAIFVATLNAVLARVGLVRGSVHCRDDDPERCAEEIADSILRDHGQVGIGLIGLNPALAEGLSKAFGPDRLRITDLNPSNIGKENFGVEVWDGTTRTDELIEATDVVLLTGTTLVNDTFDSLWHRILKRGRAGIVFGVTASGVCALTGIPRLCPRALDGITDPY